MDEGLEAPDVQMAQGVNVIPLIQGHLSAVEAAQHPHQAALPLAHLYYLVHGLAEMDQEFQSRWNRILDGDFTHYAADLRRRMRFRWRDIWEAKQALLYLLDRRGMLFRLSADDPTEVRHDDFLTALDDERHL